MAAHKYVDLVWVGIHVKCITELEFLSYGAAHKSQVMMLETMSSNTGLAHHNIEYEFSPSKSCIIQ